VGESAKADEKNCCHDEKNMQVKEVEVVSRRAGGKDNSIAILAYLKIPQISIGPSL
jgi:hypothetical protein